MNHWCVKISRGCDSLHTVMNVTVYHLFSGDMTFMKQITS